MDPGAQTNVASARGRARPGWRERGQALTELALVTPLLLFLLLAAVDVGRLFYTYIGVQNAAREGAAYGSLHPTWWASSGTNAHADPANVTYAARQELGGDASLSVSVSCSASCASTTAAVGNTISVTATHPFSFLVPNFVLPNLTLGATQTAVIQ